MAKISTIESKNDQSAEEGDGARRRSTTTVSEVPRGTTTLMNEELIASITQELTQGERRTHRYCGFAAAVPHNLVKERHDRAHRLEYERMMVSRNTTNQKNICTTATNPTEPPGFESNVPSSVAATDGFNTCRSGFAIPSNDRDRRSAPMRPANRKSRVNRQPIQAKSKCKYSIVEYSFCALSLLYYFSGHHRHARIVR